MENSTTKEAVLGIILLISFIGFIFGAYEAGGHGGQCAYNSIMSYTPGHFIACELFRQRFNKESDKK